MSDSPRERLQRLGLRSVSVPDLLAFMVAGPKKDGLEALPDCTRFLGQRGINAMGNLGAADLQTLGLEDPVLAARLLVAIEIGRRSGLSNKGVRDSISGPKDVADRFAWLQDEPKEYLCVLLLDTKKGILGERTVHVGTVNAAMVGPREVFREAIREGAASIVVVHNHPSGDPTPSEADFDATEKLAQVGELLDIPLDDHVIIGHNSFQSLRKLGYL